jgi:hypothetical protein
MAQMTRLSLIATPGKLYGSFSGKIFVELAIAFTELDKLLAKDSIAETLLAKESITETLQAKL